MSKNIIKNNKNNKKQFSQFGGTRFNMNNINNPFGFITYIIKQKNCSINLVSDKAYYSIVLELDLTKYTQNGMSSPFIGLNNTGNRFNTPINSLILKIMIIEETNNNQTEIENFEYPKETTNYEFFSNEVNNQVDIYKKTINKGNPICPFIVTAAILDNNSSNNFIKYILALSNINSIVTLSEVLNRNKSYKLGIIVMENLKGYITFENYQENYNQNYNNIVEHILFTILRLYLEANVINMDLNNGNIMCKLVRNKIDIKLIDFGNINNTVKKNRSNANFLKWFYSTVNKYTTIMIDYKNDYDENILFELINQYNLLPYKENLANIVYYVPILEIVSSRQNRNNNNSMQMN